MKIHCTYTELVPVAVLEGKRHPKSPSRHSTATVSAIADALKSNGIREPLVVSKRSGLMTRGHGRLEAALLLGYEMLPVDFQGYESEHHELADMMADHYLRSIFLP